MLEHPFTKTITLSLEEDFGTKAWQIFLSCPILQYINIKTRSADRGSKARGSFANLYAVYVLVEDYTKKGFDQEKTSYKDYEGAKFSDLLHRQRQLPFGQKLQNHALNHRLNEEFKKYFPTSSYIPVIRDAQTNRYWFNENLLVCKVNGDSYNISRSILKIIEAYTQTKQDALESFIKTCETLKQLPRAEEDEVAKFVLSLLAPNVDARLFEIVSYSILKYYYHDQSIFWGFKPELVQEDKLRLYKTGRTNANDGGIDFVMKPLGRFFQVTETTDVKKYFLDIDKIQKYPIAFVIKSDKNINELKDGIRVHAEEQYPVYVIVDRYMSCIEEIINIPTLVQCFNESVDKGHLIDILDEIVNQSKVEFNYE